MSNDDNFWNSASGLTFENEAAVETRFIEPLLRALGYSEPEHIVPKYPVIFQQGRQGRRPEADFVVFAERPHSRSTSLITVEAKHPDEELSGGKEQGESYAANIRTPLLIVTNGRRIEVWQYQPTYESELVLDCSVSEILSRQGEIEALLSKDAVLAYVRTMRHKSLGLSSRDLGAYERAEFERNDGSGISIARRLKNYRPNSSEFASIDLIENYPGGALIVASSGYGKTTLLGDLRRQAMDRRWSGDSDKLPIELFLPELASSKENLESYLHARVVAHCPHLSPSAFRICLRDNGAIIFGESFDRIPPEFRQSMESSIITFRRDFPKTQIFLFTRSISRPERLALPSVEILELNDAEQNELIERFSVAEGYPSSSFWSQAPNVLRTLCRHPLILQLTLAAYWEQGQLPTRVEILFQKWLERLLPNSLPLAYRLDLKRLLTSFANATVSGPLTEDAAVELVREEGFSDDLLQFLLSADALVQRGASVELQHEALADYLRALDVVRLSATEAAQRLRALPLREGSQLPALLMAVSSKSEMQRLVWTELASADITAAMGALRYRAEITSGLNESDLVEVSRRYLSEIIEGIELPLRFHFSRLAAQIRSGLVGIEVDNLGIVGAVQPQSGGVGYSFVARTPSEDMVTVGHDENARRYFRKNLFLMGLRLDSGRLVGMTHIREELLELVKVRRLNGGAIWAEERTLSRLYHLVRKYNTLYTPDVDLVRAKELLAPISDGVVKPGPFESGQIFAISDLTSEIDLLISQGKTHLNPWWLGADSLDLTTIEGQARLNEILNVHYRRTQLAYKEIVEKNFPSLAHKFPFYQVIPIKYEIEVELHDRRGYRSETLHWRWVPVATFDDAGATVTFPTGVTDQWSEAALDAYEQRIDDALAQYGRSAPDCRYTYGWRGIPDFIGDSPRHDEQVDETSVIRAAAAHIKKDLEHFFAQLPASDQQKGFKVNTSERMHNGVRSFTVSR